MLQNARKCRVNTVLRTWREHVANAMVRGEATCVTQTSSATDRVVLDDTCAALELELQAVGWTSLEWRPADQGTCISSMGMQQFGQLGGWQDTRMVELRWHCKDGW